MALGMTGLIGQMAKVSPLAGAVNSIAKGGSPMHILGQMAELNPTVSAIQKKRRGQQAPAQMPAPAPSPFDPHRIMQQMLDDHLSGGGYPDW